MSVIISNWIETSVAEALQLNVAKSAVYFASSSFHKCSRVAGYNQSVLMPNQAATSGWQIKVPKSFIVHVSFCITTLRGVKFATWTLELTDRCPDAGIYRLNWISPSCLCLLIQPAESRSAPRIFSQGWNTKNRIAVFKFRLHEKYDKKDRKRIMI